jgi:alkylation response protein AidB-like acyl-CoA dehydrogenase
MNLNFTKEDIEFRDEARTWLEEHVPTEPPPDALQALREFDLDWQRTQYEGGWAGISWPKQYGGRGLSVIQQLIWHEEYASAGAPNIGSCFVGMNHAGPTLIECANDAQKAEHLPLILRGEVIWCQGFSEPDAGSDLASLRTRALIDGDELVVNGRKIWTSYSPIADFQELLVRTGSLESRHRGLTWVICDMTAPGITIRPIPNVNGIVHFAEVTYDEVRVPLEKVVGKIGEGWNVAMATLSFERGSAFIAHQIELSRTIEDLMNLARETSMSDGRRAIEDDETGRRLALARAEASALRAMTYRAVSRALVERRPGPEGSMIRLYYSELVQRVHRLGYDIAVGYSTDGNLSGPLARDYLDSLARTIGGGSKEIQRNIIGERVLGLPRQHRVEQQ